MQLETSTSSLDTQMAKENAIKSIVTSGKDSLHQLGSWITANAAKATLFTALTFTAPDVFGQVDVSKNDKKDKVENSVGTAKNDINSGEKKVEPEWAREYKKAALNTVDYISKNSALYLEDSKKLPDSVRADILAKYTKIISYSKVINNLSKILLEKPFNEKEQQALKNIQKNLIYWSTEGLHPYIDKVAYLTLQELNVFISTFETPLIVKNNQ